MSQRGRAVRTVLFAGAVAAVLDIAFIIVYYQTKDVPVARVLQGVAAGALGRDAAVRGGLGTAALGLALHVAIAISVAAAFYAASRRLRWLVERAWVGGLVFGLSVWLFMQLAVLPLTATPPRSFPPPQWQPVLAAHVLCVGWPIALITRRFNP